MRGPRAGYLDGAARAAGDGVGAGGFAVGAAGAGPAAAAAGGAGAGFGGIVGGFGGGGMRFFVRKATMRVHAASASPTS